MKKQIKKWLATGLSLTMALTLLAGCSGGDGGEGGGASSDQPKQTTDPSAVTVVEDMELNVGYPNGIESLTPFRNNIAQDAPYFRQIYESLAILDTEKGELVPWCAKSWNTEDGLAYDVELYDYITDAQGNSITADDVVWFMQESMNQGLKPCFAKIASVEKTGDYTFRVTMTANIVGAFETCLINTFVVSRAAYEASTDSFGTSVVSTSPYVVTSFTPSADMTFERRDDYWQKEELMPAQCVPNVKKLTYKIIQEASQQGVAVETGVVDMFIQMDATTGASYVDQEGYTVELSEGPQGWTLFFSGADSSVVANDPALCQAIGYSIDIEGMISALCGGYATKMYDVCPAGGIGFNKDWESEEYFDYNPDKAKELLAESNYNGETLKILVSNSTFTQRMAQMIQQFLINVGINCDLDIGDLAYVSSIRLDGTKYDMFINTIGCTYLADHWSIRYDMNAYNTGDGTSRHDATLADMLYETWTHDGYTAENIEKVHDYLMENGIARGLLNPQIFTVIRPGLTVTEKVIGQSGWLAPVACVYAK